MELYLPGETNTFLATVSLRQTKAALSSQQLSLTSSASISVNICKQYATQSFASEQRSKLYKDFFSSNSKFDYIEMCFYSYKREMSSVCSPKICRHIRKNLRGVTYPECQYAAGSLAFMKLEYLHTDIT
jgi:hypothetical protein